MKNEMISALIRDILHEELELVRNKKRKIKKKEVIQKNIRRERISISSDIDLQKLIRKIIELFKTEDGKKDFLEGNIVFHLDETEKNSIQIDEQMSQGEKRHIEKFERKLLSERLVDEFPQETKLVVLGKKVRTTPLARDRLRQRGILIERIDK